MEPEIKYGKVTADIIAALTEIVGEKNILVGEGKENYSRDEAPRLTPVSPDVVIMPTDTDAVSRIMRLANEHRIPVTPRGAGTGVCGGAVPIYGGIVLSLERMNKILEIDRDNFLAVVEPGVIYNDLCQAVEEQGLCYPLFPGEATASIGGNAGTNAGGMRAVKYGVTRDFILGLEAVLPTGEIIHTGGKFIKCSTAYDLTQLIVGSEGTLAVITKIILKLIPLPGKQEVVFIPFPSLHDAIMSVPEILKEGILPVGLEFIEQNMIKMIEQYRGKEIPLHEHQAFLMIFVEADSEEAVHQLACRIGEICLKHGAIDIYLPASKRAQRNLIESREKAWPAMNAFGIPEVSDVVVPRSKIAEYVERVKAIAEEAKIPIIALGHAGDGNVHLNPLFPDGVPPDDKIKELFRKIYQVGISLGGTISGEHGIGLVKKEFLSLALEQSQIELMKRIKQAFDPEHIMNPGKIFDL
jgi:glycolate oxidase